MNTSAARSPFRCVASGLVLIACFFSWIGVLAEEENSEVQIVQSRGADQTVDYASLTKFGPWDDRNYALTAEDLEYLAPDEQDLHDPIPAFFRVELRKEIPHLRRSGPAQYPRSAVPLFQNRYGGLLRESETDSDEVESLPDKQSKRCGRAKKS